MCAINQGDDVGTAESRLERVWRKAAEQGCGLKKAGGRFILYDLDSKLARPVATQGALGRRRMTATLEQIEAWLDRDRRPM
jgi:hypothetical protein